MSNCVDQINPPTEPGLYEMRWTHGTALMRQWVTIEVMGAEHTSKLWARIPGYAQADWVPIEHYTGAEWRRAEEKNMTEKTNEKKPAPAKPTRRRRDAAKIEARLNEVLDEIDTALNWLGDEVEPSDIAKAKLVLEKARIIGEGGDLQSWYQKQLGV